MTNEYISLAAPSMSVVETATATSPLSSHFKNEAGELVKLIEAYYRFLNQKGGPSYEIANLRNNHDVDLIRDDQYLDAIERTIATNIPQSRTIDRAQLYKIIANYYNSRGSEDSIHSFFRIFYNEIVRVSYPKELLFTSSDKTSESSDVFKIRDSRFYQEYSYVINSRYEGTTLSSDWIPEYLKFIHPAGLKFFVAYTIECINLLDPDLDGDQFETEIYFNFILKAFTNNDDNEHSYVTRIKNIFSDQGVYVNRALLQKIFVKHDIVLLPIINEQYYQFRKEWRTHAKYVDTASVGEFYDMTQIESDSFPVNPGSGSQMNSYSCFISKQIFKPSTIDSENLPTTGARWYDIDDQLFFEDYSGLDTPSLTNDYYPIGTPFNNSRIQFA